MRYVLLLIVMFPLFGEVALPYSAPPPSATYEAAQRYIRFKDRAEAYRAEGNDKMADLYDRRARQAEKQLNGAEGGEHRGFASRIQEERAWREKELSYQRRRAREPGTMTARESQIEQMTGGSWQTLPHQGTSSAKKRQYLWPYKQGIFPPNDYSNGR
ncbi:MAG: hypothetical protein JSR80_01805 [Verrucomicrobia bacterium]|nr:hypothetical protein [Verrucomicrobiota bacterium]